MAVRSVALILAALALSLPLAGANVVVRERSPVVVALTPQLHCDIVFDTTGPDKCEVTGQTGLVTHVRIRIAGTALAAGYVDKVLANGNRLQVAAFSCAQSCNVKLTEPTDGVFTIFVNPPTYGVRGSVLSVALESQPVSAPA